MMIRMHMVSGIILLIVFTVFLSIIFWSVKNGIGPSPSGWKPMDAILQAIPEGESGIIYELGSGWGQLAVAIARRFPQSKVIGVENSPAPFFVSLLLCWARRVPNVKIRFRNLFQQPLGDASGVVCYLYPGAMKRLRPILEAQLAPGAWVVSSTFAIPGWTPSNQIAVDDLYRTTIFVYRVDS